MRNHKTMYPKIDKIRKAPNASLLMASIGLLILLVGTFTLPFNQGLFSKLFNRPFSHAAGGLSVNALNSSATFNSIGLEVLFSNNDSAASATLQFKKSSDANWRRGLDLWLTDDQGANINDKNGPAFYGSAVELDPGTQYDIQVTITDPNGLISSSTLASNFNDNPTNPVNVTVNSPTSITLSTTVTTRVDNIPAASSLTPTYFVRTDGSDSNSGTSNSSSGAWATIGHAMSVAPSGVVIQVGPGHFAVPRGQVFRTTPVTLLAQYPAVDDNRNPINAGLHSIIDRGTYSSPIGSADQNAGVWIKVTPDGNSSHPVWEWIGGANSTDQIGYASSLTAEPQRFPCWLDVSQVGSLSNWVNILYTNITYNYGCFIDPANSQNLYVRLPGDLDPNNYYIITGGAAGNGSDGLELNGPNERISGFEVRVYDSAIMLGQNSQAPIVDHNLLEDNAGGVKQIATRPPSVYGTDAVIQYNLIKSSDYWTADKSNQHAMPWDFIKSGVIMPDGSTISNVAQGNNESAGIGGYGGKRTVIRYNSLINNHDGIASFYHDNSFDRYGTMDTDVYGNLVQDIQDDPVEPGESSINWRIWDNSFQYSGTCISINGVNYGPVYYFRNQCYRTGIAGLAVNANGNTQPGGVGWKWSPSFPTARMYVINNTFWTDDPGNTYPGDVPGVPGGGQYGTDNAFSSQAVNPQDFYVKNNIWAMTSYVFEYPGTGWQTSQGTTYWHEDYNWLYTSDPTRKMEYYGGGSSIETTLSQYQSDTKQGAHSNLSDLSSTFSTLPALTDPINGDLSLTANSPQIDAGTIVPNIADLAGINYSGSAPDLGAIETGLSVTPTPYPSFTPTPTSTPTPIPLPTATPVPTPSPAPPVPANRSFSTNSNDLLQTTTSSTMTNALSLNLSPSANSTYYLLGSWVHSSSIGSQNDSSQVVDSANDQISESDRYGNGTYWVQGAFIDPVTFGASPGTQTYSLQFSGSAAEIKYAKLIALQADPVNDHYVAGSTQVSTSQTSFQDVTPQLQFTPAFSSDYLIVASADVSSDYGATDPTVGLNIDGTLVSSSQLSLGNGIWQPFMSIQKVSFSANTIHTIKLQFHSSSAGLNSYLNHIRLVAINLATLGSEYYSANDTPQSTTSQSYVSNTALNQTITTPAHYLELSSGIFSDSLQSTYPWMDFTSAGSKIEELNPSLMPGGSSFFSLSVPELTASTLSLSLNYASANGSDTATVDHGHLALLQLDNVSTSTPAPTSTSTPSSSSGGLVGDLNGDGVVNLTDLSIMATNYGLSGSAIINSAADINQDGVVNLTDLSLLASHYGT